MATRGDRFSRDRRSAGRGNEIGNRDPRDLEIKRLRRRVRDLELKHEIQRLKKRVQDLEALSTWKETEPEEPVGDELSGDEEHPTNGDTIYVSHPVYDEYGDEEWYSWVSGGDHNLAGDESPSKSRNVKGVTTAEKGGGESQSLMATGGETNLEALLCRPSSKEVVSMFNGRLISRDPSSLKPNNTVISKENGVCAHSKQVKLDGKKARTDVPFDPGGTCTGLEATTHEVELLMWVVIIASKNRLDIPFDPGGFTLKTKLEDEFISKRGRMMQ